MSELSKKLNSKGIKGLWLKLIAAAAMLCDHIAVVFVDGNYAMRAVGRLAFPIFAFFIVEGYTHTRNVKKYAIRLLLFSIIAQAPYYLAFKHGMFEPNVIFTLFLGLIGIWALERGSDIAKVFIPIGAILLAEFIGSDHGSFGVLMIFLFFLVKKKINKLIAVGVLIIVVTLFYATQYGFTNTSVLVQLFYLIPLALIYFYNGQKGPMPKLSKWFFYVFYPLHLLIIWLISNIA